MDHLETLQSFSDETPEQFKHSKTEDHLEKNSKKSSLSLNLKKTESYFSIHGNAFSISSNGESPSLMNPSMHKENELKNIETFPVLSFSSSASLSSCKYYDENRSQFETNASLSSSERKPIKPEQSKTKKQNFNLFRCGFF